MIPPGARKEFEPDDPLALVAEPIPEGDLERMSECLVEEFALLGWAPDQILDMFNNPFYQAAHTYFRVHGQGGVAALVSRVLARCGSLRVRVVEAPVDPNDED